MITNNTIFCKFIFILGGFFMPKTKFQEIIFTILMVIVMVYAMICYNISLEFLPQPFMNFSLWDLPPFSWTFSW